MQTPEQLVEKARQSIQEVSVDKAAETLSQDAKSCVIDVREADEFEQGHLKNAVNIPRGTLEFKIADTVSQADTPIVVYCKTGGRAALSAQALHTLGYQNVTSIEGGYEAWVAAGKPTA